MQVNNEIHFIWMGAVISEDYALGILEHLDKNYLSYKVNLWTDKPHESRDLFKRVVASARFKNGRVNAGDLGESAPSEGTLFLSFAYEIDRFNPFSKKSTKEKSLSFIDLDTLDDACGDLKSRYVDAKAVRNFGRASDVLRLAILKERGGIYMDTDVESKLPLPAAIDAPDGFLMGYGQAGIPSFTNAVMAASKESNFIPNLIESIRFTFQFFDAKNWWISNNDDVTRTRNSLNDAKVRSKNDFDQWVRAAKRSESEKKVELARRNASEMQSLRTNYQKAMENGTLAVTGPTRVELFLYKRMLGHKAQDPFSWMVNFGPAVENMTSATFNEMMGQFKLLVAKPAMLNLGVVERYSFPMECINIRSDASWM